MDSDQDPVQGNRWQNREQIVPTTLRDGEYHIRSTPLPTILSKTTDPEYAWVTRHTWQSWRERYKKNSARLDHMIAVIVEQKKPAHGEKGQYGYVRKTEERPKRGSRKTSRHKKGSGEPAEDSFQSEEKVIGDINGRMTNTPPIIIFPSTQFEGESRPSTSTIPRRSPDEEEMEDGEDSEEWQIRIGSERPPSWVKRKSSDEQEEPPAAKRARSLYDF